jgi:hypothetical protein
VSNRCWDVYHRDSAIIVLIKNRVHPYASILRVSSQTPIQPIFKKWFMSVKSPMSKRGEDEILLRNR